MASGEVLRSEPSFSDWTLPDLQCYEVGSSSGSPPKEECMQDEPCLVSPQTCKRLLYGAATGSQKQSWAVNPAQLRRAVKRSFELLQVWITRYFVHNVMLHCFCVATDGVTKLRKQLTYICRYT